MEIIERGGVKGERASARGSRTHRVVSFTSRVEYVILFNERCKVAKFTPLY